MNQHEEIRELLALDAAGALSEEQSAAVRRHTAECAACAEELHRWERMIPQLSNLPSAAAPAWLAQRTVNRVKQRREEAREQRFHRAMLGFLVVFSWAMTVAIWPVVHWVAGIGLAPWLAVSIFLTWITAGSAAVVLGSHPSMRGRNI